jgi:hypothetical protein
MPWHYTKRRKATVAAPASFGGTLGSAMLSKYKKKRGRPRKQVITSATSSAFMPKLGAGFNPRRRRRKYRTSKKQPYFTGERWIWVTKPSSRNPGIASAATSALKPSVLMSAVPVGAGMIGASLLDNLLTKTAFMPSFLKSGLGSYALSLIDVGLLGMATRYTMPKYAGSVTLGAVVNVLRRVVKDYLPQVRGYSLDGMYDYLSVGDARNSRQMSGLEDYLTVNDSRNLTPLAGMGMNPLQSANPFNSYDPSGSMPTMDEVVDRTAAEEMA